MQTGANTVSYGYDPDGIRIKTTENGSVTNYLADKKLQYAQVLEERDGTGSLIVSYIHGDDLISQKRSGAISYYLYDGQMSTRKLTNISEAITDSYVYDAFGILINRTGTTINDYLYTGEQYDPNVGFYYLRARYYNPSVGRFLTMDTVAGSIFEPKTLHKYLYAGNDPVNNIDPSGHQFTISMQITIVTVISVLSYYATYYGTGGNWKTAAIVALVIMSAGTAYVALPATIAAVNAGAAGGTATIAAQEGGIAPGWAKDFAVQIIRNIAQYSAAGGQGTNYWDDYIESLAATPRGRLVLRFLYEDLTTYISATKDWQLPPGMRNLLYALTTKILLRVNAWTR